MQRPKVLTLYLQFSGNLPDSLSMGMSVCVCVLRQTSVNSWHAVKGRLGEVGTQCYYRLHVADEEMVA